MPAEGTSCLWNLFALGGPGRADGDPSETAHAIPFNVMSFHAGGTGARPGKDGLSATAFPSGVRNVPIEVNEAVSPLVVWRKEYRQDSGGAGEFRGGLGQVMEVGTLDTAPFAISAYYDRIDHPAHGREGGHDGMAGTVHLASGPALARQGPADRAAGRSRHHRDAGRRRTAAIHASATLPRSRATSGTASSRRMRRGATTASRSRRTGPSIMRRPRRCGRTPPNKGTS